MQATQKQTETAKLHFGVRMSDLTAIHQEKEGKLFREVIQLFVGWADIYSGDGGVLLPDLQSLRKAIALGQVFEWKRTGTPYKLVIERDHVKMRDDEFDNVEYCVFVYADINLGRTEGSKRASKVLREQAKEFDVLVEDLFQKRGVAQELRAYEFRRG